MALYDRELLSVAKKLLDRSPGQRGRLPDARIRRSISTAYYALFHFLAEESTGRLVGVTHQLRFRRRLLGRTVTHTGMRTALSKCRGQSADPSVAAFLALQGAVPAFARRIAQAFIDAQTKREAADYNLDESLSETDARDVILRVERAINDWRAARTRADRDFKQALATLIVLKGQLRRDN